MQNDFLENELLVWEQAQCDCAVKRMYKTDKRFRDPRVERIRDFRHRSNALHYSKESKYVRRMTNARLRRKLARNLFNEVYDKPVNAAYKTYGWLTWLNSNGFTAIENT